jgi:8-oxo-dGTP pyrophosphatase MutT (NUDIX family)
MINLQDYIIESANDTKYANMIVVSKDNKILILRRANYMKKFKSLWGFPGGHISKNDNDPKEAAIRELKEETKIDLSFAEKAHIKEFKNIDDTFYYYLVQLENDYEVKISKEHSKYEWYSESSENTYKWMPDVFECIQEYYMNYKEN